MRRTKSPEPTIPSTPKIGAKEKPAPLLVKTVSTIFDILHTHEGLAALRKEISTNNQFTLKKDKQDEYIETIGRAWLETRQNQPGFPDALKSEENRTRLLAWFKGESSPFSYSDFQQMGPFAAELKAMRKGLNSALRASLELKIGLSADFDPTHFALGIPASQSVTSKTTKYSDPMMQLCLTNMIAFYKPQGEQFLASTAREVQENLIARMNAIEEKMKQLPGDETLSPEHELLKAALKILDGQQELIKAGGAADYRQALTGSEPEKILLRKEFASLVTERKWIYISEDQISRPVQHALRGCNVIGLTGTATRNLTYVLSSNGNDNAMKNVEEAGRQSTAEVVYRLAKSLPDGLDTKVKAYKNTLDGLVEFAKVNSGYNFLVNQAGVCDTYSQKEIIKALHYSEGPNAKPQRPIVFLDMENEKDSVMIKGVIKKMSELTREEKKLVMEQGFYYYHTPHARGTHFDIPTGSKGALMLSPTVNANDRDQAMYRPRELGEGHVVEPYISEQQKVELEARTGAEITVADMLKDQHNKTLSDEEKENLSAYKLHVTGLLTLAAERTKEDLQLRAGRKGIAQTGDWLSQNKDVQEANAKKIAARVQIFGLLENFFIQESGNEAILRQLDREISQGGEISTNVHLIQLVDNEVKRAKKLIGTIEDRIELNKQDNELLQAYQMALAHISRTEKQLLSEKRKLEREWGKIKAQFPATTLAAPSIQETAETEAEEEEEKEAQAETLAEMEGRKRSGLTRSILEELDEETLGGIADDQEASLNITPTMFVNIANTDLARTNLGKIVWKRTILISNRLHFQIQNAMGSSLPEMRIVVVKRDNQDFILLLDPWEGDNATSPMGAQWVNAQTSSLLNGGVFMPTKEQSGELKLLYTASPPLMKGIKDEYETPRQQAEILLALLHIGMTQLTAEQWKGIEEYWKQDLERKPEEREALKKSLTETLGKTNPSFLREQVSIHLWNKPPEKIISLGQTDLVVEKITDLNKAKVALKAYSDELAKIPGINKARELDRWIGKNVELEDEELEELKRLIAMPESP